MKFIRISHAGDSESKSCIGLDAELAPIACGTNGLGSKAELSDQDIVALTYGSVKEFSAPPHAVTVAIDGVAMQLPVPFLPCMALGWRSDKGYSSLKHSTKLGLYWSIKDTFDTFSP